MNLVKITCPQCHGESGFSLAQGSYTGPYRCGKCRGLFNVVIECNEVKSTAPFDPSDAWKVKKNPY